MIMQFKKKQQQTSKKSHLLIAATKQFYTKKCKAKKKQHKLQIVLKIYREKIQKKYFYLLPTQTESLVSHRLIDDNKTRYNSQN